MLRYSVRHPRPRVAGEGVKIASANNDSEAEQSFMRSCGALPRLRRRRSAEKRLGALPAVAENAHNDDPTHAQSRWAHFAAERERQGLCEGRSQRLH